MAGCLALMGPTISLHGIQDGLHIVDYHGVNVAGCVVRKDGRGKLVQEKASLRSAAASSHNEGVHQSLDRVAVHLGRPMSVGGAKDLDGILLLLKSHRVHQFAQRQPLGALDSTGCAAGHGYKEKGKSSLRSRGERSGPLAKAHSAGSPCRGGASGLGQGC